MINRNDLAKQFELVVQQEIINHNTAVLQTNLEVNALRKALSDLSDSKDKKISALESKNIELERDIDDLKSDLEKFVFTIHSSFNDVSQEINKNFSKLASEFDRLNKSYVPRDIYKENLDELHKNILELRNQFSLFDKNVDFKSNHQYSKFNERLEKHKKEIAAEPSVIKELRRELNTRINTSNVDITGIYEELQIQKKKQFVLEKECERLKTQLERIKKES